jgi:3-oxoacyl-[acyl-carrier-protein] synthase-3
MADKNGDEYLNNSEAPQSQTGRWRLPFWGNIGTQHTNGNGGTDGHAPGRAAALLRGAYPGRRYAHIVGWGMAVPERVLTNLDLEAIVETNDEWIKTRTGIVERRIADERESTGHLALQAARKAIEVAGILPSDIDLIIVATSTPEHIFPSTASLVQDWLGATRAGAYDLSAACSGFVYALDMASAKIRAGDMDTILVIGAETMSRVMNWSDRGTCILFGDGAGAVIVASSPEPGGILSSVLRSDGSGWDMLGVPTVGSRDTYLQDHKHSESSDDDDVPRLMHRMHMNGREVFRFATRVIQDSIKEALKLAGVELQDVNLIVPHQANQRILEAAARTLKLPQEKFYSNVGRYGNTSAASIPIALCEAIDEGLVHEGDNLIFCGFGGGLTWATMVVRWEAVPAKHPRMMGVRRQAAYWYALQRRNVLRRWRSLSGRLAGSPTPEATMRQLQDTLDRKMHEAEKEKSDTQ